jgi:hypothetical protein
MPSKKRKRKQVNDVTNSVAQTFNLLEKEEVIFPIEADGNCLFRCLAALELGD